MKSFKNYILRPLLIIVAMAVIFSFIAGTGDFTKWNIWLRLFYIICLFYAFVITERD